MADSALSLTKTVVAGTVKRVFAAIEEDAKLKEAAQQDLRFIVDEFQMMQSFLKVAKDNKERTSNNEVAKTWVQQLRDLAFDVEDCVEFVIHLDTTSRWSWVWRVVPLPSCMAPAWTRDLDQAVAQLKQLKARVEEVSQRNTRYNLLGGDASGSSSTPPPAQLEQLDSAAAAFPSTVDILIRDLWKANMKQSSSFKSNLGHLVTDAWSKKLKVISVWRSEGADLEASFNAAFCQPEFEARARVKLMHPFNIQHFLNSLLNQLSPAGHNNSVMHEVLTQLLSKHKYLIILEDLTSEVEWNLIEPYLPDSRNGSRIVISTQQLGVALSCTGEPRRVLELAQANDGFIYAFYKLSSCIGTTELLKQIAQRRVVSLWRDEDGDTKRLVRAVYDAIRERLIFEGVTSFRGFSWFNASSTSLQVASGRDRLFESFCQCCPRYDKNKDNTKSFLDYGWREGKVLVVIEGLQSKWDWNFIKDILVPENTMNCIIIIANNKVVAKHCEDNRSRNLEEDDQSVAVAAGMEADRVEYIIHELFTKELSSCIGATELLKQIAQRRVVSLWRDEDGDPMRLVRAVYDAIREGSIFEGVISFQDFCWFNIQEASGSDRLLERFCRCCPGYDKNKDNPVSFLRDWSKLKVLVVIEGLESPADWNLISNCLLPENTKNCIVIIANSELVAKHCPDYWSRNKEEDDFQEDDEYVDLAAENVANNHAKLIIRELFTQEAQDLYSKYSFGNGRFGSHGCSDRIEASLQFAQFIQPDQEDLFRSIFVWMEEVKVNAVCGATGVGKSALIRFFYYTAMAYSFEMKLPTVELPKMKLPRPWPKFKRFGWADVSEAFDLAEFSRRLLLDFHSYDRWEMEKIAVGIIQGQDPIRQCQQIMSNHKCLVVIDGLRSTRDWDSIEQALVPKISSHECYIIVISIDRSIAEHCVGRDRTPFLIRPLRDKSALQLFNQLIKAHGSEWIGTERKLKHSRDIAPRCGGLPKLINAVAQSEDFSLWAQNINVDLVTMFKNDPRFYHLRGVLSRMLSYFDVCSDSMKLCIFYLPVFPTNCKIRKARLLRRWIAEGYSRDTTSHSAKENAERLLDDLVQVGIIQKLPSMSFYQISGFYREYIIKQPMEDNLVFALEKHCKPNSQRMGRHLIIMKSWEREQQNVFKSIEVSRLRSLTVYGEWKSFFISEKMKRIRVLDLEGTSGFDDDELRRIFGILLSLKFISLRGCKKIHCLPETLGGLRQLESLDVRGTSIVTLPRAIIKLQKIQYIRAGMFLQCEDWASATQEENSDDEVGSEPLGIEPTPQEPTLQDKEARTTTRPDSGEGQTGQSLQTPRTMGPQASRILGPALTATPPAEGSDDSGYPGQHQHHKQRYHKIKKVGRHCTSGLSSRLSPLLSCRWFSHSNNNNGGVEVPAGIEDMPALHTLGTVNINCAGGKDFLAKLKDKTKFQQLLKLNLCGINKGNWKDLCVALSSANDHLESLSLGFDEDFTDDSCFNNPPRALKSLRLYGHIHRLPNWTWVKDPMQLVNLKKLDFEVIISSQGDMDQFVDWVSSAPTFDSLDHLCVKLCVTQVTCLEFKYLDFGVPSIEVLKIDCSSALEVSFDYNSVARYVRVLIIHCSKGSEFRISDESWIYELDYLDTVWLKGYDRKAEYVACLMKQIATHPRKPVFKFEKLESA